MSITPVAAAIYSMNGGTERAFELTYDLESCKGYKVRSVVMANGMMRVEGKTDKGWVANKPYIVKRDKKRQGDRIVDQVKAFLSA